jgi:S1-C subfamily serine protease
VAERGRDFEDWQDDEPGPPLLPPEDRIWRHPSELSEAMLGVPEAQVLAARRRWLASTPTRAGAGAAGIVGALLATGVVLIGTHLTAWLHDAPASSATPNSLSAIFHDAPTTTSPLLRTAPLEAEASHVESALVEVQASRGTTEVTGDGVIVSRDGYIAVPAAVVAGASAISVLLGNGEELIATLSGSDPVTGVAVVRVEVSGLDLTPLDISPLRRVPVDSLLMVAWRSRRAGVEVAPVRSAFEPTSLTPGPTLLETCPRSLGLAAEPVGTLLVDAEGEISGMVVADQKGGTIAAPGWVVGRIAQYLISNGRVDHGWLGIEGRTGRARVLQMTRTKLQDHSTAAEISSSGNEAVGVDVMTVRPGSAAARAGIRPGDLIESIDGEHVSSMSLLQGLLYLMAPNTTVRIDIVRAGRETELRARLAPAA